MKKEKFCSGIITDFLNMIEIATKNLNVYKDLWEKEDKLTQDILHTLELEETDYADRAKLASKLRINRKDRRYYKDVYMILEEISKWSAEHKRSYEELKQVLGKIRKIEQYQKERCYYPRTVEKLQDLLEKGK